MYPAKGPTMVVTVPPNKRGVAVRRLYIECRCALWRWTPENVCTTCQVHARREVLAHGCGHGFSRVLHGIAATLHSVRRTMALIIRLIIKSRGESIQKFCEAINTRFLWSDSCDNHSNKNMTSFLRYSQDHDMYHLSQFPQSAKRIAYEFLSPNGDSYQVSVNGGTGKSKYVHWLSVE